MSDTNVITKIKNQAPTKEEKTAAPYSFGTAEYQKLKKDILSSEPLSPASEIEKFNDVVEKRGYGYFDKGSVENWKDVFGKNDYADILKMAETDATNLLLSAQNPADPQHDQSRLLFQRLGSNEEVKKYFLQKEMDANGFSERPFKDLSYEARILGGYRLENQQQIFEFETFKKLMLSKWAAAGYGNDISYIKRFFSTYAIALSAK